MNPRLILLALCASWSVPGPADAAAASDAVRAAFYDAGVSAVPAPTT